MVLEHARDDLFIEGKAPSYSKIKKPENKQLQLEGTVDITDASDGTGTNAAGITINGVNPFNPGGSDTHVQFHDSGNFGGSADFTWDGNNLSLTNAPTLGDHAVNKTYADALIGGADTQIQFNNSGSFDGSADLTWDGAALKVQNINSVTPTANTNLFDTTTNGDINFATAATGVRTMTFGSIGATTTLLRGDIKFKSYSNKCRLQSEINSYDIELFDTTTSGDISIGGTLSSGNLTLGNASQSGIVDIPSELRLSNKGTVTQITSVTTGVILNKPIGVITTVSLTVNSHNRDTFTVTNSYADITSVILVSVIEYTGLNNLHVEVTARTSGTFDITIFNSGGGILDAPAKIAFVVL